MRHPWRVAILLLVPMALFTLGLAHGGPRPAYSPSTTQRDWLHPVTVYHPDEFAYVGLAYRMLHTGEWNPHYYHNPSLNIYSNIGVFILAGARDLPAVLDYNDREIAPFALYVTARYLSALYTLLAVALAHAAGRLAFGAYAGRAAAGLVALSPLMVQHAHYATPNAQATMLTAAALLAAIAIFKDARPARLPPSALSALGGLLVGLTMAARYNFAVIGLVTGLALLTAWWRHRRPLPVILGFGMMPLGFALGTPGIVFASDEVIRQVRDILHWYRVSGGGPGFTAGRGPDSMFVHWRYLVLVGIGPLGFAAAMMGAASAIGAWRRRWQGAWIGAVLLAYVVVYTALALPGIRLQNNLLPPLIPALAVLGGAGAAHLRGRRPRLAWAGLALALAWIGALSLLFVARIATPDNRMRAQEWIYQHVPRGSRVLLLEPYNVPLDPLDYETVYSFAGERTPEQVQRARAQIIVYSAAYPHAVLRDRARSDEMSIAREEGIRAVLRDEWIELARFPRMPWPAEDLTPDDVSYWHQFEIVVYCNPANCPVEGS